MDKAGRDQVQLWLAREAGSDAAQRAQWQALLNATERERWQRFRRAVDRDRFVQARALVRSVLGTRLGIDPAQLQFTTTEHGKPEIAGGGCHFNLSHTRGFLALAVSRTQPLGVDVEALDRTVEMLALSKRYFAAREHEELLDLDGAEQRERFFALWTLKEAWLKARGLGLRVPLDAFSFSFNGKQALIQFGPQLEEQPKEWQFRLLARDGFRIALAVQTGGGLDLQLREWTGLEVR